MRVEESFCWNHGRVNRDSEPPALMRDRARRLRRQQTDAERELWMRLRARQDVGVKFRRQYAIGPYVVDFCCLERSLVVEVDGGQHIEQARRDARRDAWLKQQGFCVLRFWDNDVLKNMEGVLESIAEQL